MDDCISCAVSLSVFWDCMCAPCLWHPSAMLLIAPPFGKKWVTLCGLQLDTYFYLISGQPASNACWIPLLTNCLMLRELKKMAETVFSHAGNVCLLVSPSVHHLPVSLLLDSFPWNLAHPLFPEHKSHSLCQVFHICNSIIRSFYKCVQLCVLK